MIHYMIDLIESYYSSGIFNYFYRYIIPLAFLATIPILVRDLMRK